jgi:hypothetical protein
MRAFRSLIVLAGVAAVTGAFAQGGGVVFFSSQASFRGAIQGSKILKGMEDFEEGRIQPGQILAMDDPLNAATNNAFFQPGEIEENLQVQSNTLGGAATVPSPAGVGGMAFVGSGVQGSTSKTVVANTFVNSLDLMFRDENKTAVGFNVIDFNPGTAGCKIDVYNTANVFLGTFNSPGNGAGTNFVGVVATGGQRIGRINIFDVQSAPGIGAEGADNIEMWVVPEPGTMAALGLGALVLLRRRKKA